MGTIIHKIHYKMGNNQFYIKRDDLLPQYYGGNKVRITQAYYRDMLDRQCDCLVAYGSPNSNMCRVIALLCSEKNIPCYVIYGMDERQKSIVGINDLIVQNAGAGITLCLKADVKKTIEDVLWRARKKGYKPYYIFGNSSGKGNEKTGMSGYIGCYDEIKDYAFHNNIKFDYIFVTSGTGITQSGLIAGKILNEGNEKIIGVSVARERKQQEKHIAYCLNEYFADTDMEYCANSIEVYDGALQGGYGMISHENKRFIQNFSKYNSLPLDHTYVGKGIFGMMKYIEEKKIVNKNVLFIHTGATPLFYEDLIIGGTLEKMNGDNNI